MPEDIKNYWRLRSRSLFFSSYVFLDTREYLADQLFIQHQVDAYFGPEYQKPGEPFRMLFCKIRKKDETRFLQALSELSHKMLLLGHTDYEAYCGRIMEMIAEVGNEAGNHE